MFGRSFNQIGNAITNKLIDFNDEFERTGKRVDSWKNTDSIWKRLYGNKSDADWIKNSAGEIVTGANIDTFMPKMDDAGYSSLLQNLIDIDAQVKSGTTTWQDYFSNLKDNQKWQIDFVQNTDLQKASLDDVKVAQDKGRQAAINHNAALKQQTLGAKAAKFAMSALATVGNILLGMGISWAISEIVGHTAKVAEAAENALSEFQKVQDELKNNKKTIEDISDDYKELSKGVDSFGNNVALSADEYERYNDIVNQIADMFPTMVQGYTDEGNAILKCKGDVDALTEAYKKQQEAANNALIASGGDIWGNFKNETQGDWWHWVNEVSGAGLWGYFLSEEASDKAMLEFKDYMENNAGFQSFMASGDSFIGSLGIDSTHWGGWIGSVAKRLEKSGVAKGWFEGSAEYINRVKREFPELFNSVFESVEAEYEASVDKMRPLLDVMLEKNSSYEGLNSEQKQYVKRMVDNLGYEFYYQSGSIDEAVGKIVTEIINPIQDLPKDTESAIKLGIETQTKVNNGDISILDYQEKINDIINKISGLDGETKKNILLLLDIKADSNGNPLLDDEGNILTDEQVLINNLKTKVRGYDDAKQEWFSHWRKEDLEIATSELGLDASVPVSWEELTKRMEAYKKSSKEIKETIPIKTLENTSDKIKTLSSAFKELSDDGYITTKTLGELQTATGLSGDEWEEYKTKLLNAKAGSSEFNQIMSEMTFKILDATFKKEGLVDATEDEIAAVLRENGVSNASAVAHDYLARTISSEEKAKAENSIRTRLLSGDISGLIENLSSEATACGITETAFKNLAIQMVLTNETNMSFDDQIANLKALGVAAEITAAKMAGVNGYRNTKYSEKRNARGNMDSRGGLITSVGQETINGSTYIVYYGENGQIVDKEKIGADYDNLTVPKIPTYTSDSKSSSDKNTPDYEDPTDAIINRINLRSKELEQQEESIQNAIEIAELENDYKKQISLTNDKLDVQRQKVDALKTANDELHQMAEDLRNSTPDWNEEEWFDSQGNATEAYNTLYNNSSKEEQEKLENQFEKISKIKKAWVENDEEHLNLTKEILQTEEDIVNLDFGYSQDWIDERNTYNDWALFNDSEIDAWERVIKRLKEDYKDCAGAAEKLKEAEENLFNARKEEFDKATDFANSYLDSQKTLLQANFDVENSIAEARHEINKELETSMTMYAYLDEETRRLLFNQEDYNKLSQDLNEIQDKSLRLKADYEQALDGATLDTIEEITSNYEMQYETLMKSYEIAKAELEVAKKRQQLDNVLAEKNVRMLINGQWEWVAKTQDVINAQSELADAEWARKTAEEGLKQTESINDLTAKQNKLGTTISLFEDGVIDLDTAVGKVRQMFDDLPTAMQNAIALMMRSSGGFSSSSGSSYSSSGGGNSSYVSWAKAQMAENSKNWHTADADGKKALEFANQTLGKAIGSSYDPTTGTWKHRYASGTKSADKGLADINEILPEGIITNNGTLIPMANFSGGEMVFNHKMMDNLWHQSQIPWNIPTVNVPKFVGKTQSVDQSIHIDKVEVNKPADFNGFLRDLTTQAKSHNAITNKM